MKHSQKRTFMDIEKMNSDEFKAFCRSGNKNYFTRIRKMPLQDLLFTMINRKGLTLALELRNYMKIAHPGTSISKPGYLKQRMKLNPDALTIEDTCDFDAPWEYDADDANSGFLSGYEHNEILYHIRQAEASGLIDVVHYYDFGTSVLVRDLTPQGHEFLANISTEPMWKKVLEKGTNASLPILIEIAKEVALKHFLG